MNANIKGAIINIAELLIILICGSVLIITTLNGQPSETIIGIFGGYLGVAFKNANNNNPKSNDSPVTSSSPQIFISAEDEPLPTSEPETTGKKTIFDDNVKKGT